MLTCKKYFATVRRDQLSVSFGCAGQKSLLDIQREEAEHAAAAQAAEAAEAASRGPVITAGPGGWAKVAAANAPAPFQGEPGHASSQINETVAL